MNNVMTKPEGSQWTDDQWKAIAATGQDILVAAAAGSGKTAVLVERIIKKLISSENPLDVDRLLVVTFTNASAAEMRNRIGEALEKELKNNPSSLHLRRQLTLLNRASISTLHSFCLEVIRRYYYLIDLDPGFRIADDIEAELIREEILDELFEEQYSLEGNEPFFDLIDRYTGDRSDADIQIIVRKLYDFARANPSPAYWLKQVISQYTVSEEMNIDSFGFIPYLLEEVRTQLEGIKAVLTGALHITKMPGGPVPRLANIEEDLEQIRGLIEASNNSFSALHGLMQTISFSRLKPCKGDEYDPELAEKVSDLRKKAKSALEKVQGELFARPLNAYVHDMKAMKPVVETLAFLVTEFGRRYETIKKEKGLVDFSDLEHYCLQVLRDSDSSESELIPSDVAKQYRVQFTEVLVDEYQDTNMVQESIIRLVTKDGEEGGNLFMVGDVKQSIYRFRLAEPFLFLSKYKRFTQHGHNSGLRIDLNKNFRSRAEILHATNFIFEQIMDERVGEIQYDEDALLKLGASYPSVTGMETEVLIVSKDEQSGRAQVQEEEEEETNFSEVELETAQLEARLMAKKIKELIQSRFQVYDRKLDIMRAVTYRDFVILLRSMPWAPQIMEEFKQQGIPMYANLAKGYFDATEVKVMMSLLQVIDNPYQDIPLAAVLRSPIVGLTDEELALVRLADKKGTYYEAVTAYMKDSGNSGELYEKVLLFYDYLQKWRVQARQGALSSLIWQLYRDTGFFEFVGGLPGGKQRQANLRALYDRARQYESTSFRGLFRFLRFVERMRERGDDLGAARALGEQEDVVRLMTIHSSKGLEFPVVFVAGLSKQFNLMDLHKPYLLDKEFGFGSKLVNPKLRVSYPTLLQQTLKRKMKKESMAEEMRVLYVALTRAKEKLFLVGTAKSFSNSVAKWKSVLEHPEWVLPAHIRSEARSYLDWIGPALIRHRDSEQLLEGENTRCFGEVRTHPSSWKFELFHASQLEETAQEEQKQQDELLQALREGKPVNLESKRKEDVEKRLKWNYKFQAASLHRSKQSVSEMKRQRQLIGEDSDEVFVRKFRSPLPDRPKFLQEQSLTAAEKGTAMHLVMQHIPLHKEINTEMLQELVASMVTKELLTEEQAEEIELASIAAFFETSIAKRLQSANQIYREVPFSLALPASEAYSTWGVAEDEPVLVQGIIDCLFEDEDGLVLIDFKTDNVANRFGEDTDRVHSYLIDRYRLQIDLYAKAIEKILNRPLSGRYLYFFDGSHVINV